MKKWLIPNEEKNKTTRTIAKSRLKKPYHTPRLAVYGDLSHLTGGRGGTGGDGGTGHQTRP